MTTSTTNPEHLAHEAPTDEDAAWANGAQSLLSQLRHMPERQQARVHTSSLTANPQLRAAVLDKIEPVPRVKMHLSHQPAEIARAYDETRLRTWVSWHKLGAAEQESYTLFVRELERIGDGGTADKLRLAESELEVANDRAELRLRDNRFLQERARLAESELATERGIVADYIQITKGLRAELEAERARVRELEAIAVDAKTLAETLDRLIEQGLHNAHYSVRAAVDRITYARSSQRLAPPPAEQAKDSDEQTQAATSEATRPTQGEAFGLAPTRQTDGFSRGAWVEQPGVAGDSSAGGGDGRGGDCGATDAQSAPLSPTDGGGASPGEELAAALDANKSLAAALRHERAKLEAAEADREALRAWKLELERRLADGYGGLEAKVDADLAMWRTQGDQKRSLASTAEGASGGPSTAARSGSVGGEQTKDPICKRLLGCIYGHEHQGGCYVPPPVCSTCHDTHVMTIGGYGDERQVMCTNCPTPCEKCRAGFTGAYCATPRCACLCHKRQGAPPQPPAPDSPGGGERAPTEPWTPGEGDRVRNHLAPTDLGTVQKLDPMFQQFGVPVVWDKSPGHLFYVSVAQLVRVVSTGPVTVEQPLTLADVDRRIAELRAEVIAALREAATWSNNGGFGRAATELEKAGKP